MANNIVIALNDSIKVEVVPQYIPLKRRTGQLLKDFGLFKHQRKEVYDLISKFMHANSHQLLREKSAPSELETHNNGLRKSRSLGSINTLKQDQSICPLQLTNTDFDSDDDTPHTPHTPLTHTTSPDNSIQSHSHGAVVININSEPRKPPASRAKIKRVENEYDELNIKLAEFDKEKPNLSTWCRRHISDPYLKSKSIQEGRSCYLPDTHRKRYELEESRFYEKRSAIAREIRSHRQDLAELKGYFCHYHNSKLRYEELIVQMDEKEKELEEERHLPEPDPAIAKRYAYIAMNTIDDHILEFIEKSSDLVQFVKECPPNLIEDWSNACQHLHDNLEEYNRENYGDEFLFKYNKDKIQNY